MRSSLFGFSRGAYTARSVAGMIGSVGLITREALLSNRLPEALDRYRTGRLDPTDDAGGRENSDASAHPPEDGLLSTPPGDQPTLPIMPARCERCRRHGEPNRKISSPSS